ncbi:MAG: hypothetical protein CFE44_20890, partial [Burkholderiales bacterium PBB4]
MLLAGTQCRVIQDILAAMHATLRQFLVALILGFALQAAWCETSASHAGPLLTLSVQRGSQRLPASKVDRLQSGDQLKVTVDRGAGPQQAWALVLALVSPVSHRVTSRSFDLSVVGAEPGIDIEHDDQVPVVVLAPQVKTLFGWSTSFEQSVGLIADAIHADPQRFMDLQKLEQMNVAIASITAGLDEMVVKLRPEQAADSAKTVASKFGVKQVDAECFKGGGVDTQCVATSIVSSRDLKLPSVVDLSSMAQPFATALLSADVLANIRLAAAASTFISNKYRDQYDMVPSLGKREPGGSGEKIQLVTKTRFLNGAIKTAYIYVPSWFVGKQPELTFSAVSPMCLATGELPVTVRGQLPLLNYWHSWKLEVDGPDGLAPTGQLDSVSFIPEKGAFAVDASSLPPDFSARGTLLHARLLGRYAFTPVTLGPLVFALPWPGGFQDKLMGLPSLAAGEQASLTFLDGEAGV